MIESAEVTFPDSGYSLSYGYIPSGDGGKGINALHPGVPETSLIAWKLEAGENHFQQEVIVRSGRRGGLLDELRFKIEPGEVVSVQLIYDGDS